MPAFLLSLQKILSSSLPSVLSSPLSSPQPRFFGAMYYWANWLHILVFFFGAAVLAASQARAFL
jgi:hypothetical protein